MSFENIKMFIEKHVPEFVLAIIAMFFGFAMGGNSEKKNSKKRMKERYNDGYEDGMHDILYIAKDMNDIFNKRD